MHSSNRQADCLSERETASALVIDEPLPELQSLHASGRGRLAAEVPLLGICVYDDAASIPELELSSNRFVRFSSSKQAIQTHLPALVPAPAQPNSNTPEYMVNMTLEAVPAALALPIMVRKPLHGAIKVKLQFAAPAPCTISASMQLHALDAQHIETVQAWLPSGTQNALISGSKNVSAQLKLGRTTDLVALSGCTTPVLAKDGPSLTSNWASTYVFETQVVFDRAAFAESSKMQPRWLVVSLTPFRSGVMIFAQIKVPTIVMSHPNQEKRGLMSLWGSCYPRHSSTEHFRTSAARALRETGTLRTLSEEDYAALQRMALDVYVKDENEQAIAKTGQKRKLEVHVMSGENMANTTVQLYIKSTIDMLCTLSAYWDRESPRIICGFSVTRERAETLLCGLRAGAFLLRFGMEAGTLIMSVRVGNNPSSVTHVRWRESHLHTATLEQLLERDGRGTWLLDEFEMLLYPRELVLRTGYVPPIMVQEARHAIEGSPATAKDFPYGAVPAVPTGDFGALTRTLSAAIPQVCWTRVEWSAPSSTCNMRSQSGVHMGSQEHNNSSVTGSLHLAQSSPRVPMVPARLLPRSYSHLMVESMPTHAPSVQQQQQYGMVQKHPSSMSVPKPASPPGIPPMPMPVIEQLPIAFPAQVDLFDDLEWLVCPSPEVSG